MDEKEKITNNFIVTNYGYLLYLLEYDKENRVIIGNIVNRNIDNIDEFFEDERYEDRINMIIISFGKNESFDFRMAKGRDFYTKLQRPSTYNTRSAPKRSRIFKMLFPLIIKKEKEQEQLRAETHDFFKSEFEEYIKQKAKQEKNIKFIDEILEDFII